MSKQFKVGDLVRVKSSATAPFWYDVPFGQVVRVIGVRTSISGHRCVEVQVVDPCPPPGWPPTYTQIVPVRQCKLAKQRMRKES